MGDYSSYFHKTRSFGINFQNGSEMFKICSQTIHMYTAFKILSTLWLICVGYPKSMHKRCIPFKILNTPRVCRGDIQKPLPKICIPCSKNWKHRLSVCMSDFQNLSLHWNYIMIMYIWFQILNTLWIIMDDFQKY